MQEIILWITKMSKTPLVSQTCRNRHRFGSLIQHDIRQKISSAEIGLPLRYFGTDLRGATRTISRKNQPRTSGKTPLKFQII